MSAYHPRDVQRMTYLGNVHIDDNTLMLCVQGVIYNTCCVGSGWKMMLKDLTIDVHMTVMSVDSDSH